MRSKKDSENGKGRDGGEECWEQGWEAGRRSINGKNWALIRGRGYMVHGGGGGNSALIYLVGEEGQREEV